MDEERNETAGAQHPQRMSQADVSGYNGVTLGEDGTAEKEEAPRTASGVRVYNLSTEGMPLWKKLLTWCAIAAGIVLLCIFAWFFLVGGLVIAGAAAVVYLLKKYILK